MSNQLDHNSSLIDESVIIQQQQAIAEFQRWVNESQQIDNAYRTGSLDEWLKKKIERELSSLDKLSGNNNGQPTN